MKAASVLESVILVQSVGWMCVRVAGFGLPDLSRGMNVATVSL
ncbi:hypothetical protein RBSH_04836 [Rhodopirellula baltica SH28]|uniref:Uncharacterized protein n=1 Tax=Rhodopirellula baltica SH28 TaxID=993517 RepID=K5DBF5_RHOBT|nr:hypothetical protein RBSH_04836 [Rhodopirellula baltica SH28]